MHILTVLLLGTLWTLAWMIWWQQSTFPGKVAYLLFPKKWFSEDSLMDLSGSHIDELVDTCAVSRVPMIIIELISCRYCLSAHFSLWTVPLSALLIYGTGSSIFLMAALPLLWAAQAGVACVIYDKIYDGKQ